MIPFYVYLSLGAFIMALAGTRLTLQALKGRRILIDRPNARSNHKKPIPRGGGIAIVFTLSIFMMQADAGYDFLFALFLLAGVSLIDDMLSLPAVTRLAIQLIAVALLLHEVSFPLPLLSDIPPWIRDGLLVMAWIWFINLYNFMDGIDGLAATETICIAGGICLVTTMAGHFGGQLSTFALIVLGASAGFLWWNWHPAKIFMGDVGSVTLGFILGYLLLMLAKEGFLASALILPAYHVTDATVTLVRRAREGKNISQAHSEHAYQKAVRSGKTHVTVTRLIFGVNLLLIALATLAALYPSIGWFNVVVAYAMAAFIMKHLATPVKTAKQKDAA